MTITTQISRIRKSAEKMHAAETEVIGTASVGDVVRQGDLYLVCLEKLPGGVPMKDRQLAPGTTQGSRHVLQGDCSLVVPNNKQGVADAIGHDVHSELIGPAFHCDAECELTHPEHGNKVLPQGTNWAVVYQRAYAEEIRRVQD